MSEKVWYQSSQHSQTKGQVTGYHSAFQWVPCNACTGLRANERNALSRSLPLSISSFSAFLLPLPPPPLFPPLAASRFGRFGGEGARCPRRGFEVGADVIGTGLGRPSFFFRCRRRHWRSVWEEMGRRVPLPPLLNTQANELAVSFTQLPFPPSGSRMES